jgi:hypothetical protein
MTRGNEVEDAFRLDKEPSSSDIGLLLSLNSEEDDGFLDIREDVKVCSDGDRGTGGCRNRRLHGGMPINRSALRSWRARIRSDGRGCLF